MIIAILLAALALWGVIATIIEVRRDGYRPVPTDWSRVAGIDAAQHPEPGVGYR
ncbi:hypothetical protein [Microbacterium sp. EF45047]|uniref:hypothetical protein n=1 Tax=Microbacterium sp. EF45047 TaxID=2809708 RepID=UPI002349B8AE|nr:hypothetical protein [Microbacterium sp. EF45047]WCM55581.1 hypothetical protein JRG78_11760 [Microbacterium sp. EF45047]